MLSVLNIEKTLAVIKPHALRNRFAILRRIQMSGLHVLQERCVKLTIEQATEFMSKRKYLECEIASEIEVLCSGPMIVLCLAQENAIEKWKRLMGPESSLVAKESAPSSLRALYGDPDDPSMNAVDGSKSTDDACHELQFFFPNMILSATSNTNDRVNNYLHSVIYQQLTDALYEMTRIKPSDPLEWLGVYMLENNTSKPAIYAESPQALLRLMELKMKEKDELNQSENKVEEPAKCGCYLESAKSSTSLTSSTCCNKLH